MTIKSSKTLVDEALEKIETLDPIKVKQLFDQKKCTLIDIRDIREVWNDGAIEDSVHIPRGMLEFWLDSESPYYQKECGQIWKIESLEKLSVRVLNIIFKKLQALI